MPDVVVDAEKLLHVVVEKEHADLGVLEELGAKALEVIDKAKNAVEGKPADVPAEAPQAPAEAPAPEEAPPGA